MTVLNKEVTANYVPAAAVNVGLDCPELPGVKGRRRENKLEVKSMGSTHELLSKLFS